jgi:hypothetical protein
MVAATRICSVVVGSVLTAATMAYADPIVLRPASMQTIFDEIDGQGRRFFGVTNQFQLVGRISTFDGIFEARALYEFGGLQTLRFALPRTPVVLQINRTSAGIFPDQQLRQFDIFGYIGDGVVNLSDFENGLFLARFNSLPLAGHDIQLDVTGFVGGLRLANVDVAGFSVRRVGAPGFMQLSDPRLAATPEPASLTLLALGGSAILVRRRFARSPQG